ncbi:cytochrome c oxidase subunit [Ascobolus immersus RN42]|uniref:Cytochrome c oxidase subunit 8, mitochondrial n=1 Tax=Ascobolus immersus RN42 TaxID=1160509 RepID=A0A3N4IDT1_ASCIM|nr:cytochrome c oxidase subunit [Ascobolus immersus RN42]
MSPIAAQLALRTAGRRAFSTSPKRMGGYHYPEGPRSNLPFNPQKPGFALKFIAYSVVGFGLPFGIAVWQTSKNAA